MGKPKSHVKNIYTIKREEWAVKIGRLFGTPLAKGIARLPVKIHPNIITLLSLPFALLATFYFFNNQLILGAIFFFVSYVLDCTDGALARLTNTVSKFGKRLDFYVDTMGNVFMYFGLWYSQYYLYGEWFLGGSIIFVHYLVMVFGYVFITDRTYKTIFPSLCSYYGAADEGILTFFFAPILGIFRLAFPILVLIQFISYVVIFLRQKEEPDVKKNIRSTLKI